MKNKKAAKWISFWERFAEVWQNSPELAAHTREIRIHRRPWISTRSKDIEVDWVLC
jgi:hypothetical protein